MAKKEKIQKLEEEVRRLRAQLAAAKGNTKQPEELDEESNSILKALEYEVVDPDSLKVDDLHLEAEDPVDEAEDEGDIDYEQALRKREQFALAADVKMRNAALKELNSLAAKARLSKAEVYNLHRVIATAHPDDVLYVLDRVKAIGRKSAIDYLAELYKPKEFDISPREGYRNYANRDLSYLTLPPAR